MSTFSTRVGFCSTQQTMKSAPPLGTTGQLEWTVGPEHTIVLGQDDPSVGTPLPVFSTPSMILMMERAARRAIANYLEPGEEQVGSTVQVEHLSGAPLGAQVRALAQVTAVDGRQIDFSIECWYGQTLLGRGTHRRTVILLEKLRAKLADSSGAFAVAKPPAVISTPAMTEPPLSPVLSCHLAAGLLTVTLNRPEKRNAINRAMTEALAGLRDWLAGPGREAARVVVIQGAGGYFCAGDDLKELATLTPDEALALDAVRAENCVTLSRLPQVFLAAISGGCFGGGFMLAAGCDLVVATHGAVFGLPEVNLGWPPAYGNSLVIQLLGRGAACDLALTGRTIKAAEAQALGFVQRLVPGLRLAAEADALARQLLGKSPAALRETKLLMAGHANQPYPESHRQDLAAYRRCLDTPEARAGIQSFLAKKPARNT